MVKGILFYDLDGTIIDSSHRAKYVNGILDLNHWKQNCTKENILADDILPLYWELYQNWLDGYYICLNTAREMGYWDYEYLRINHIPYHKILSRPIGDNRADWILKAKQQNKLLSLKWAKGKSVAFYDDKIENLEGVQKYLEHHNKLIYTVNAKQLNEEWGVKYAY